MEFQIGQRVKHASKGYGRVVHISSRESIGVEYDLAPRMAHDCDGHARANHGWYEMPENIERISDIDAVLEELEFDPPTRIIRPTGGAPLLDDILRPFQPPYEPENREVKPLKLNELTQGLPLLGLRVMINPEHQERYHARHHGVSGIIVSLRGGDRDAYRQISRYKQSLTASDWSCTVRFDTGRECDVRIVHMLPIIPEKEVILHEIYFDNGEKMRWTPEEYEAEVDKYVITYQWGLKKHTVWNDEERQKVLDAH